MAILGCVQLTGMHSGRHGHALRPAVLAVDDQGRAILPPNHPSANVPAQVGFNCDLFALDNTPDCIYSALLDIDYARSIEGVGPMILPNDYVGLAPAQQLFVVFNLERTSRGSRP